MKLHIENSIVIEMNGKTTTLGCGEYEFDSASEFIEFIESLGGEPKQPLIKDEKIRKAVRAWAEVNGYKRVEVTFGAVEKVDGYNLIRFETRDIVDPKKLGIYDIAELCGEEEE